ncbi:MAG: hypothetical protein ACREAD_06550 [Nitrosopumilaceae archaeon]
MLDMKIYNLSLVILVLCIISIMSIYEISNNEAFATTQVLVGGEFNIAEKFYKNGTASYDYYLFSDNKTGNQVYLLKFAKPDENLLFGLAGKSVQVTGHMTSEPKSSNFLSSAQMDVDTITPLAIQPTIKFPSHLTFPTTVRSAAILLKFSAGSSLEPHTSTYVQNRFYDDPDSLNQYWTHTSYGLLTMTGHVINWQVLPHTKSQYFSQNSSPSGFFFSSALQDAITLIDPTVNFTQTDQVSLIFNEMWLDPCSCIYAEAFIGPHSVSTAEGPRSLLVNFVPDLGADFAIDRSYFNGIGVIAHEMGHNLVLHHTPPPSPSSSPYDDTWSLMSAAGNFGNFPSSGPLSLIAPDKDLLGWIPVADKITVPQGQQMTFTLDILNQTSPGPNYLMGKVPYGNNPSNNYLTLEARANGTFDFTPNGQTGLMIYNFSSTGHPENPTEPSDKSNVVDTTIHTTGPGDWDHNDLHAGKSYVWSKYNITITDVSQTANTITVLVNNNAPVGPSIKVLTESLTASDTSIHKLISKHPSEMTSLSDDIQLKLNGNDVFCGKTIVQFNSVIQGTGGAEVLSGTLGDDLIVGNGGNDKIFGRAGNDCIISGNGNDYISGGAGNDTISSGAGDDRIWGLAGDDTISGGDGNDRIAGGIGNDVLNGENGNDTIWGQSGNDTIDGGSGTDICVDYLGTNTATNCEAYYHP